MAKSAKHIVRAIFTGLAATVVSAHPVHAEEPVLILAPSDEWQLQEQSDRCRLSRNFGEGENQTLLRLEQGGVEPRYKVSIFGRPVRNPYGTVVSVQFGPNEQPSLRGYITSKTTSGRPALTMYGVLLAPTSAEGARSGEAAGIGPERVSAITRLSLARSIVTPFAFDLGSMGEPLRKLGECAASVATKLDLAKAIRSEKSRSAVPTSNPGEWLTPSDYPRDLLRNDVEGRIRFRLTVDEAGEVTGCHIEGSDRPQMFDDTVCLSLMRRASFRPALDAQGRPVASYWRSSVKFMIPS